MAITHTITRACVKAPSVTAVQLAEAVTSDFERNVSMQIPAQSGSPLTGSNFPVAWQVTRAKLQDFTVQADRPCTIYANAPSTGSPQDTIPLVVTGGTGQVLTWTFQTDGLPRCMFTGDVTALYVTPPVGGAALNLTIIAGVNN